MAMRRGARLEVPGASGLGRLRMARSFTERRRHGIRQGAAPAQERRMDRSRRLNVQVAEAPRLALRIGGLEVVQQLLVIQVLQP